MCRQTSLEQTHGEAPGYSQCVKLLLAQKNRCPSRTCLCGTPGMVCDQCDRRKDCSCLKASLMQEEVPLSSTCHFETFVANQCPNLHLFRGLCCATHSKLRLHKVRQCTTRSQPILLWTMPEPLKLQPPNSLMHLWPSSCSTESPFCSTCRCAWGLSRL